MNNRQPKLHNLILILVVLLVSLLLCSCVFSGTRSHLPQANMEGPYEVVRIIDGDTIAVNMDGTETSVRLIGIDAPESVHPDESKNTEEGLIASAFAGDLLSGKRVYLEFDSEYKDAYGRVLAYVYLENGSMVNSMLLDEGMAQVYTIPPNTRYEKEFLEIQRSARNSGRGFWGKEYR